VRTASPPRTADVSGVVLPEPPGQAVDALRAARARARAARAPALLDAALSDATADERTCLETVRAAWAELEPTAVVTVAAGPWAALDLDGGDDVDDPRGPLERGLSLARHLIGLPELDGLTLVLPRRAFGAGPLFFPRLGLSLDGFDAPVAIAQRDGAIHLTWVDGRRATVPLGYAVSEPVPGLTTLPQVGSATILNGDALVARAVASFDLAPPPALAESVAEIANAFALVRWVWPAAGDMLDRYVDGLVVLAAREYTRSHSPEALAGTVMCSPAGAVTIGDLLCHESAHIRLHLLQASDPLLENDDAAHYRSPWRTDRRPLIGVLLGVHAFLNVCHYYRRVADHDIEPQLAEQLYGIQAAKVREGLALLEEHARPTPIGAALIDALATEVERL
jgi:HEXXH motif-containing protein